VRWRRNCGNREPKREWRLVSAILCAIEEDYYDKTYGDYRTCFWSGGSTDCDVSASSYESTIYVQSDNKKINAKSIMGMMTLDLPVGEQVVVTADGVDEEKAVNDIEKYLSNN
jgi:phosphotransferase system HPr (HPr) family protein